MPLMSWFVVSVCAVLLIVTSPLASNPLGSGAFCTKRIVPPSDPEP